MSNNVKAIVRLAVAVALFAAVWVLVPIPSESTPQARMAFNSWMNGLSPRMAEAGFNLVKGDGDYPFCKVSGETLMIVRDEAEGRHPHRLTFATDNIAALGVRYWLLIAVYFALFHVTKDRKTWGSFAKIAVSSAVILPLMICLRGVVFGAVAALRGPEAIRSLDNPVRVAIILAMLLPLIFSSLHGQRKEKSE